MEKIKWSEKVTNEEVIERIGEISDIWLINQLLV